jgi:hypothetical protein
MKTSEAQILLTQFFYKENHLHFQILLQSEEGTKKCGDFTDYNDYRKAYDQLQLQLTKKLPLVNFSENLALAAV